MEHGKGVFPGAGLLRSLSLLLAWVTGHIAWNGSGLVLSFAAPALYFQRHPRLKILAVTFCVFTKT